MNQSNVNEQMSIENKAPVLQDVHGPFLAATQFCRIRK